MVPHKNQNDAFSGKKQKSCNAAQNSTDVTIYTLTKTDYGPKFDG
jgi:hypothetical protein